MLERQRAVLRSIRSALARGVNIQLKREDGYVVLVYPPIVLTPHTIQFRPTGQEAQKPVTLRYVDIIAVQPR